MAGDGDSGAFFGTFDLEFGEVGDVGQTNFVTDFIEVLVVMRGSGLDEFA